MNREWKIGNDFNGMRGESIMECFFILLANGFLVLRNGTCMINKMKNN